MGTEYGKLLEEAKQKGGLTLATRVAIALGVGGDRAKEVADDPERVKKAREVIDSA